LRIKFEVDQIFHFIAFIYSYCAVSENIYTPPTEGIGISLGVGVSLRPTHLLKKGIKLNWNFQRGGDGSWKKSLPWGRYALYFLELHITVLT